jgi:hypothetical protein
MLKRVNPMVPGEAGEVLKQIRLEVWSKLRLASAQRVVTMIQKRLFEAGRSLDVRRK